MQLNEFPKNIIKRTMRETLQPKRQKKNNDNDNEKMIKMYLPYEKGISEKIASISRKFNIRLINTKGKTLKNLVNVNRNSTKSNEIKTQSGVVYKVDCKDCNKYYIGETGRTIQTRMNEHEKGITSEKEKMSGLSQHIKQTGHQAKFNDVKVLYKENNFAKRKFKEAIAIKKHKCNLLNKKEEIKILSDAWENLL